MGSQSSSQWTPKQPLSWFSGLLGSSSGAPEASDLGPAERELIFLKREFNKEIKSLLSQPTSFDLPSYCSLREPHRTLDFLAAHRLFPALQNVVNQAADKLSGARRQNGCPLFPTEWEPTTEPNSEVTPGSEGTSLTEGEAPYSCSLPTRNSSIKMVRRKSIKPKGGAKPKEGGSPMSSTQGATRFRLQVTPTEESQVPSPSPKQEVPDQDPKAQRPPMPVSGPPSSSQKAQPWQNLHITLPTPKIEVDAPSSQNHLTEVTAPLAPHQPLSYHLPMFSSLTSLIRNFSLSFSSLCPEKTSSRVEPGNLGTGLQGKEPFSHHS